MSLLAGFSVLLSFLPLVYSNPYATGPPPPWAIQEGGYHYNGENIPPVFPYSQQNLDVQPPSKLLKPAEEHLDVIKDIEVQPTQLVISTSKEGSADKLRVKIEVTDLQEKRKLPPMDLSGVWLLISRGRYTIPFLKPDRWYGLTFRSENIVNNQIVSHTENRLIRTSPRQGNGTDAGKMFEIKMHRTLEGVESLESLYMTARWQGHEKPSTSQLVVKVTVECDKGKTKETIHLPAKDDSVTIEITMDHRYDLTEINKTAHEYNANITPVQCKKVCWKPHLEIFEEGIPFSREFPEECREIGAATGKTFLRNLKEYSVDENHETHQMELVIHTEVGEPHEQAVITLSALRLDKNDSDVVYKTFSAAQSDGIFRLPLEEDAVYAVTYEYTKSKPFHYSAKEHFIVESPADNLTRASRPPVELQFEPDGFHENHQMASIPPIIILKKGQLYENRKVQINMDPICGRSKSQITLTDEHPEQSLNATEIVCSDNPTLHFCDSDQNYTKCSPILCYNIAILMETIPFNTESRCLNVTHHFKLKSSSSTLYFIVFMLLILMLR